MKIFSVDAIRVEDKLYMFAKYMNLLYSLDIEDGEISLIGNLPNEEFYKKRLVKKIVLIGNELCFVLRNNENLWNYSITEKRWKKIINKNSVYENETDIKENEYIFFRETNDNEIIYQTLDGKIHYINNDGVYKIYENEIEEKLFFQALKLEYIDEIKTRLFNFNEGIPIEERPVSLNAWIAFLCDIGS